MAWYGHLLGALAFSLPFLGLSLWAQGELFLSQHHARLVTRVLVALDRNRPEWIISSYPPISFLLALLKPSALTLSLAGGLLAGVMAWVLWNDLSQGPLGFTVRLALLASLVMTPAWAFLATQSFSYMISSFLFFLAWRSLRDWLTYGRTWAGFVAGMCLGLAFYASLYALAFGLLWALVTPWAASVTESTSPKEHREALLAKILVIAFPVLMALISWAYLNWVASGDPWLFLRDPLSGTLAYLNRDAPPMIGLVAALRGTGHELLRLPLYWAVGLIVALRARRWLPLYLVPLVSAIFLRALGFYFSEALLLIICTVMALGTLCRWSSRRWGIFLVLVALLQVALGIALPARDQELVHWRDFLREGRPFATDEVEREVATRLRQATPHSILTDDRYAYRLIARAGTARPFVLPGDATFELAMSDPARRVKYILLSAEEGSLPSALSGIPLDEFALEATWPDWQFYRSKAAPPLFNPAVSTSVVSGAKVWGSFGE